MNTMINLFPDGYSYSDEVGNTPFTIPPGEWAYYPEHVAVLYSEQGIDVKIYYPSGRVILVQDGVIDEIY